MLTVKDLACHFKLCEETVRRRAKEWGGLKLPGCKAWRFPDTILTGLALPQKGESCLDAAVSGGTVSEEYRNLLGPRTKEQHKPTSPSSDRVSEGLQRNRGYDFATGNGQGKSNSLKGKGAGVRREQIHYPSEFAVHHR